MTITKLSAAVNKLFLKNNQWHLKPKTIILRSHCKFVHIPITKRQADLVVLNMGVKFISNKVL